MFLQVLYAFLIAVVTCENSRWHICYDMIILDMQSSVLKLCINIFNSTLVIRVLTKNRTAHIISKKFPHRSRHEENFTHGRDSNIARIYFNILTCNKHN